jgi:thymidylate synthase (FAD)
VAVTFPVIPEDGIPVLDHGFVRLDAAMADDLSVANSARVSFGRRKDELDDSDRGLIRFLMRERHGTPFEHNAFRFHIRCPIFVAREWFRHRVGCLTGDTEITFVNDEGTTGPALRRTLDELWSMWSEGELNGHRLAPALQAAVEGCSAVGLSQRATARMLGVGRQAVRSHLRGCNQLRSAQGRVRRMRLRVLDEETGEFGVGHIDEIVDKGIQPVYRLALADGKQLTLTENHRVLTEEGWTTMGAAVGLQGAGESARMTKRCSLMTNGVAAHRNRDWLEARRREGKSVREMAAEAGCSYHTIRKWLANNGLQFTREEQYEGRSAWNAGRSGYKTGYVLSSAHREAIRRARSGSRSNFWRGGVSSARASIARWTREQAPQVHSRYGYTCQRCGCVGGKLHVHHIVPVWLDEARALDGNNLISLCGACHHAVHRTRESEIAFAEKFAAHLVPEQTPICERGWKLTARPVEVVGLSYVGTRQTYDLCLAGPWHNFVANGVVVHNSFNEFSMRYARATDDFYLPEPDDVRTQVGKPGAYSFEPVSEDLAEETREQLQEIYDRAYATYEHLVEQGVARELARAVLPVGAYTEFYWTVNARSLMNFISLRAAESAQREIRRFAEACERYLAEYMPITHEAFVANDRTAP